MSRPELKPCHFCGSMDNFNDCYYLAYADIAARIPWKGMPAEECPDTPRYKAIGNSFAVPVVRWIGERIEKADANDLERLHGFGKRGVGTC